MKSMPSKTVAIVQSCYIPWKGYFDLINFSDEFVLYDEAQFTKRDWRNRNQIKTARGLQWLTVPVETKGKFSQLIQDCKIDGASWRKEHWNALVTNYSKARHFKAYKEKIQSLYLDSHENSLSRMNYAFLKEIGSLLGIKTKLSWSTDYPKKNGRTEKLVSICAAAGATEYLSGPSAQDYLDESLFKEAGIRVRFMDYSDYPVYAQLHGEFEHRVSVLDLLFNEGPDSIRFMKSFH